jgi:hypothetical protein
MGSDHHRVFITLDLTPGVFVSSSQVKLLITNNSFCIVQRATAQSKTGIFKRLPQERTKLINLPFSATMQRSSFIREILTYQMAAGSRSDRPRTPLPLKRTLFRCFGFFERIRPFACVRTGYFTPVLRVLQSRTSMVKEGRPRRLKASSQQ